MLEGVGMVLRLGFWGISFYLCQADGIPPSFPWGKDGNIWRVAGEL